MLKTRILSLVCGVVLVSVVGVTSLPLPAGEMFTYQVASPIITPGTAAGIAGPKVADKLPVEQAVALGSGPATLPDEASKDAQIAPVRGQAGTLPPSRKGPGKPAPPPTANPPAADPESDADPDKNGAEKQKQAALAADLNGYVLNVIKGYQGKSYPYLLNNDYAHYNGVTSNIYYQDQLLLRAHPSGNRASHCVGITFEVFFLAMQSRNRAAGLAADDFNQMTYAELQDFMLLWYAASGPKSVSNPAYAIAKYGLGRQITDWQEAKAGDFIDFSRSNNTGHSVVFLNWLRKDGEIAGLRYWSSQESTGGIGYKEEYFTSHGGGILKQGFYIGRVGSINNYK